ncbi:GGDEF domain-containing protein [Cryobacterium breve]|uniref:GGDEF domain-containing protein n=1 Tax=Cryobacterium breve TaxID=1259258 RepID=A0ABY7NCH5_9MICO|nr:GGDEF domain-containing protein [Cryobacterium breve]WBM80222.1 GGDEF domain-containing protein [Cryobacterium breve]
MQQTPSFQRFRATVLRALVVIVAGRAVVIAGFFVGHAQPATLLLLGIAGALVVLLIVSYRHRYLSRPIIAAVLVLSLAGSMVSGLTVTSVALATVSAFTFLILSVAVAAVVDVVPASIYGAVAMSLGISIIFLRSSEAPMTAATFVGMTVAATLVVMMLRRFLKAERDSAIDLTLTDPLTGAVNRRGMADRVPSLSELAQRTGQEFGCLVLDLDHFKAVNDTYGHQRGDQVLTDTVGAIERGTRTSDLLVRLGGEEFALFVVVPDRAHLLALAEHVRSIVETTHRDMAVTVSVGCSIGDGSTEGNLAALLAEADDAMYAAKNAGRNSVHMSARVERGPRSASDKVMGGADPAPGAQGTQTQGTSAPSL